MMLLPRVIRADVAQWRINSLRGARGVPNPGGKCAPYDVAELQRAGLGRINPFDVAELQRIGAPWFEPEP
jgi:hypothetical protein